MRIRENDMIRGQKMKICSLGNRIVNNYLIPCDEGYILIDTGYENGFRRFQRKLMENGIRPEDIRYVFLTHAHDDHAGFLNPLRTFGLSVTKCMNGVSRRSKADPLIWRTVQCHPGLMAGTC